MLGEPKYGCTNIEIGGKDGFHGRASDLYNVPVKCLNMFIESIRNDNPASMEFDRESWPFILTATNFGSYVIEHIKEEPSIRYFEHVTRNSLAKELVEDIEKYMDGWIDWTVGDEEFCRFNWNPDNNEKDSNMSQKQTIEKKLEELKILIKEETF